MENKEKIDNLAGKRGHLYCLVVSVLLTGISFLFLHAQDYPGWSWLLMYVIFFVLAEVWVKVIFRR